MKFLTSKARTAGALTVSILAAALSTAGVAQSARSLADGEFASVDRATATASVTTPTESQKAAARQSEIAARMEAARSLVDGFKANARAEGRAEGWAVDLMQSVLGLPSGEIKALRAAASVRDAMKVAREVRSGRQSAKSLGGDSSKALGSINLDLTFTPVTPCRLVDTRAGAKLTAGATLNVDADGGNVGNAAGCNLSTLGNSGAEPQGFAINVTVTETGSSGFLQVQPFGVTPSTSWMNWFATNSTLANQGIVQNLNNSGTEFTIKANVTDTHVLVDVFGFFVPARATALECNETAQTIVTAAASGGFVTVSSPVCATGFTITSGSCEWESIGGAKILNNSFLDGTGPTAVWTCAGQNNIAGTRDLKASATCCRVPGN